MEGRHKPNPNIYKAGEMYLAGYGMDEIGAEIGASPLTVRTYVVKAGVSIDEAKYHRELKNGKIVMTDAGKRWARECDAVRLPIHVLLRFGT